MKVIGVLSDTHTSKVDRFFLEIFKNSPFKDIDTIIHAGDFTSIDVVAYLKTYIFYGVKGNMDDYSIRKELPDKLIIALEGVRIGITHGWGSPVNLDQKVYNLFDDPELDCIVFGHSHQPTNHYIGKTLMFNPGSFKHSLVSPRRTLGKLCIENGKIYGEIISL